MVGLTFPDLINIFKKHHKKLKLMLSNSAKSEYYPFIINDNFKGEAVPTSRNPNI
jgi:hypothetical protein